MTLSEPQGDSNPIEDVIIIGTGFVGLPLALLLASQGKRVYGVDIDEKVIDAINNATLNLDDDQLQALLKDEAVQENLIAQTRPTEGDAFVISVPTPLSEPSRSPDLSYLDAAVESILPYLEYGNLVNIESTIPPLTCSNRIVDMLTDAGFTPGDDVQLAHSPERILPGNVFEEIVQNDRIIGGITPESAHRAAKLYEPFLEGDVYITDLVSAELCKLMENTYRDVNVALANELSLIGESLGVDIDRVINLANNHPRVDILSPGIGVGGHCLPVDPWFLNEADPEHTNLITTARRINDMMPNITAREIRRAISDYIDPKVVVLGAAYKPGTYDTRNSPALEIVEDLRLDGYDIAHYDNHVKGMGYDDLRATIEREDADAVIQLVPHEQAVQELEALRTWLDDSGIKLLQFGIDSR